MKCEFCQRIGHTIHFCPSLPTRPDIADRDEYIEKLLFFAVTVKCTRRYFARPYFDFWSPHGRAGG